MDKLVKDVEAWAREKDLDIAESSKQFSKVSEEVGEVAVALTRNNKDDLRDDIGDIVAILITFAIRNDTDLHKYLNQAYDEIKDHKGKSVNGIFVEESDLNS